MKKILFALILCVAMAFSFGAVAQETEILPAEELFDGVWIQFEDGFEFYLPSDWYAVAEIPQEWLEMGVFYAACTEDMAYSVTLEWHPLGEGEGIEDVLYAVMSNFENAQIVEVNGVEMVLYGNAENDQIIFIAMDAAEPGMYCFVFTPGSDEDFQLLAALIASTIRNIPQ